MSWAMDRLGQSLADLIDTLRTLESANVDLFLHHQAIDTTTPAGPMSAGRWKLQYAHAWRLVTAC